MAAGPPVPPDRPQRRDQHRQGQLQLDARARRRDEIGRAGRRPAKLFPLIYEGQSDTACFDNALELLLMAGYPIAQAMMMMIPEAWENHGTMDDNRRAFYEYHAAMMEPWDGPAAMAFTDGRQIGGTLDRNGLRPARYIVTDDDLVVMASESGVLPIPESKIIQKWRLQPGKMFLIDLEAGRIIDDKELKTPTPTPSPTRPGSTRCASSSTRSS
jgi:glutamate synthase (NADPH/NADH) large chain